MKGALVFVAHVGGLLAALGVAAIIGYAVLSAWLAADDSGIDMHVMHETGEGEP